MKYLRYLWLFAGVLLCAATAHAQDAAEILRRSIEHDATNVERIKNYTFTERNEEKTYDRFGHLKSTESQTFEILILEGRPFGRLIARNDKPLSAKETQHEKEKLDKELDKRRRQLEKEDPDAIETRKFLREVPQAFTLTIVGVEEVEGRPAWAISAEPRPGYRPHIPHGDVLTKVRGKFWIDQAEYQWVRADAEVIAPVSFGLGLFRVAPGGKLHFEQTRVAEGVWLPSRAELHADARVAYLKKLRGVMTIRYSDYKKFQTESRIVDAEQQ